MSNLFQMIFLLKIVLQPVVISMVLHQLPPVNGRRARAEVEGPRAGPVMASERRVERHGAGGAAGGGVEICGASAADGEMLVGPGSVAVNRPMVMKPMVMPGDNDQPIILGDKLTNQ